MPLLSVKTRSIEEELESNTKTALSEFISLFVIVSKLVEPLVLTYIYSAPPVQLVNSNITNEDFCSIIDDDKYHFFDIGFPLASNIV